MEKNKWTDLKLPLSENNERWKLVVPRNGGVMEYRLTAADITDEVMIEHFKRKGMKVIGTCLTCRFKNQPCTILEAVKETHSKNCTKKFGCNFWEEKP